MAKNYKRFIQNQFDRAKSSASEFISSRTKELEEGTIKLNPQYYDELKTIAEIQNKTVQELVNEIFVQFLAKAVYELPPISVEQKEDNPLLYLDGICKIED